MKITPDYGSLIEDVRRETDALLFEEARLDYGISYLDDALLGMFPGETIMCGARSGAGKTEFATQVVRTQTKRAKTVCYCALDHQEREIENRILYREIAIKIKKDRPPQFNRIHFRYAEWQKKTYREELKPIFFDKEIDANYALALGDTQFVYGKKKYTGEQIAQMITEKKGHFRLFIIDHFHALKFEGKNEFDAQSRAINSISQAAQDAEIPVLIMGQFRKGSINNKSPIPAMDEFSGHSDQIYIPQTIIVFGPKIDKDKNLFQTYFHVEKARIAGDAKPFVGIHGFDSATNSYSEKYFIARHIPFSEPVAIDKPLDMPRWSKRAMKPAAYASGVIHEQDATRYGEKDE